MYLFSLYICFIVLSLYIDFLYFLIASYDLCFSSPRPFQIMPFSYSTGEYTDLVSQYLDFSFLVKEYD